MKGELVFKSSILGFLILAGVFSFCFADRSAVESIGFFDLHAAVVVFGGVIGSLFIALNTRALSFMVKSLSHLFWGKNNSDSVLSQLQIEWIEIQKSCREGKKGILLNSIEKSVHPEIRTCCEILLSQQSGAILTEKFTELKQQCLLKYEPVIEGWDLVARLAPSFGMVGTVTGMVQLFKNMSNSSGNLGGAMGMALLATLYGIGFGSAVGGPMSARLSNELNEHLNLIDLLEINVTALVQEFRQGEKR